MNDMNAKKTIKYLENIIFHTEHNIKYWQNEWNTTIIPARGEVYQRTIDADLSLDEYDTERGIIDDKAAEINFYLDRIVNQHESAVAQLRKIQRMSKIERLWIA